MSESGVKNLNASESKQSKKSSLTDNKLPTSSILSPMPPNHHRTQAGSGGPTASGLHQRHQPPSSNISQSVSQLPISNATPASLPSPSSPSSTKFPPPPPLLSSSLNSASLTPPPSLPPAPAPQNLISDASHPSLFHPSNSALSVDSSSKSKYVARTTKNNPKLVVLPSESAENPFFPPDSAVNNNVVSDQAVPSSLLSDQILQMEPPPLRTLKRVTAYCFADSINLKALKDYLDKKPLKFSLKPQRYDEVLYTPYSHSLDPSDANHPIPIPQKYSQKAILDKNQPNFYPIPSPPVLHSNLSPSLESPLSNVIKHTASPDHEKILESSSVDSFTSVSSTAHLFFYEYGVLVAWGLSIQEESQLLNEMRIFATDTLSEDEIEEEALKFCHDPNSTARVFGEVIILKQDHFFVKLTISHALAQSVKLSVFEERLEKAISTTQSIPHLLATTGKVNLSNSQINKKIGQLFVLRIHINLISNVLDTPEIFWSQRQWESLYKAARTYFEIPQRVEVLNQRTAVISDLLEMLKDHMTSSHGEFLEWIVIFLIAFEVVMGIIEIYIMVNTKHFP